MITIKEAEEILKKEYHVDNFLYVVDELLLPDFRADKHDVDFKNTIFTSVQQLGYSDKCDVNVYEVILNEGAQNRRVTITQEMFRILRGLGVNNAIVAFSNADRRNYRFSLLTSKYEFDGEKVVKVLSNPRRYSYSLGYGTKTKTAYDFLIGKGRGYVPGEENKLADAEFGTIPVDSIFTPIVNVKYSVENYRVEQRTDYEKLVLEIKTDGSIHPKDALKEAARILIQHFMLFSVDEKIVLDNGGSIENEEFDEEVLHMRQLLKQRLVDMDLSVRALNCLKAADIETFADLVSHQRSELMKFRNFGKKSLTEIDMLIDRLKLSFGMDVTKYNIDKKQ